MYLKYVVFIPFAAVSQLPIYFKTKKVFDFVIINLYVYPLFYVRISYIMPLLHTFHLFLVLIIMHNTYLIKHWYDLTLPGFLKMSVVSSNADVLALVDKETQDRVNSKVCFYCNVVKISSPITQM